MEPPYDSERQAALAAVREAAALCHRVQSGITPDTLQKKDKSPVTVADYGSQAVVCRAIRRLFPNDLIIAEEGSAELRQPANAALAQKVLAEVRGCQPQATLDDVLAWIDHGDHGSYAERFWTLDPIDGTKGFLRGEQYAVALALVVQGRVEVAALACPNLAGPGGAQGGTAYLAVRGQGAAAVPLAESSQSVSEIAGLRVTTTADPALARLCESVESGHSKHDTAAEVAKRLKITAAGRRLDSQAKYAVVAQGEADIYLRLPTDAIYREKIWDHAAGMLVVEEAGGKVSDVHGRPLDFSLGRELSANRGVIATNSHLHEAVLNVLQELGIE
ncbi:MAG: 3'(2'),5'-bisphosphate nucleotidase [Pirellulales bacterium]